MIREPYFNSSSSSSFIKPSNSKNYSFISHDLPTISPQDMKHSLAPSFQLSANPSVPAPHKASSKLILRRNSIEPYYVKPIKIGTLPPRISSIFKYTFVDDEFDEDEHRQLHNSRNHQAQSSGPVDEDDDYAIISDSDNDLIDSEEDSDNEYLFFGKKHAPRSYTHQGSNVLRPPPSSNGETLSRKVSDNYTSKLDVDTDSEEENEDSLIEDFNKLMKPIKPTKSNNNLYNLKPPYLQSLNDLNESLLQKSNNPNILTNVRSRTLSENLIAPPKLNSKIFNYNQIFLDPAPVKSGYDRDDFDYTMYKNYLI
ncbi:hypothetical protein DFJ63DRAFT_313369 [Scheffersomyces coipomensis]|uniref:uncharacterized protein n=1 Tax=Scheffersomyces coipomensis TaxID=1788519 RepID=UPI00315D5703